MLLGHSSIKTTERQLGRALSGAESATFVSYSIFKDPDPAWRAPPRVPCHSRADSTSPPPKRYVLPLLTFRERSPPSRHRPAARDLPRHKDRVLPKLALQHPRQPPSLNL